MCIRDRFGVFLWTKNYTFNIGEEVSNQALCRKIKFVIGDLCYENIIKDSENGIDIKFTARNDASDIDLNGFLITLDYEGGEESVLALEPSEVKSLSSRRIVSDFIKDVQNIKKVIITPGLKNGKDFFPCNEKEIIISWEEVEVC